MTYIVALLHVLSRLPSEVRREAAELRMTQVFERIRERDPYQDWRSEDAGVPRR